MSTYPAQHMSMNQNPVEHTYLRYVNWTVIAASLIWFLTSGNMLALLLLIVAGIACFREETYVRSSMVREHSLYHVSHRHLKPGTMRYVAWLCMLIYFVWFLSTGNFIALMLFIIGAGISYHEETYCKRTLKY